MPNQMMRKYTSDEVLAASGVLHLKRNMFNVHKQVVMVEQIWEDGCSAVTGLEVTLLPGLGSSDDPLDAGVRYATDDAVSVDKPPIAQPAPSAAAGATTVTFFYVDVSRYPQHMDIQIENLDAAKPVTLNIWGNE